MNEWVSYILLWSGYIAVEFLLHPLSIAFKIMEYLKEDWRRTQKTIFRKKSMKHETISLKVGD